MWRCPRSWARSWSPRRQRCGAFGCAGDRCAHPLCGCLLKFQTNTSVWTGACCACATLHGPPRASARSSCLQRESPQCTARCGRHPASALQDLKEHHLQFEKFFTTKGNPTKNYAHKDFDGPKARSISKTQIHGVRGYTAAWKKRVEDNWLLLGPSASAPMVHAGHCAWRQCLMRSVT